MRYFEKGCWGEFENRFGIVGGSFLGQSGG